MVHICLIKHRFKERKELFDGIKSSGVQTKELKAIVTLQEGVEVSFLAENALEKFLEGSPKQWQIESERSNEVTVMLVPRVGRGHSQVDDCVLETAVSRYGKVIKSKRCTYAEYPTVETGVRQFLVRIEKPLPSSFQFGWAGFMVAHKGQVKVCHKCGSSSHIARQCNVKKCFKCQRVGHLQNSCENLVVCGACGEEGHVHATCPKSYASRVISGSESASTKAYGSRVNAAKPKEPVKERGPSAGEADAQKAGGSVLTREWEKESQSADSEAVTDSQIMEAAPLAVGEAVFSEVSLESARAISEINCVTIDRVRTVEGEREDQFVRAKVVKRKEFVEGNATVEETQMSQTPVSLPALSDAQSLTSSSEEGGLEIVEESQKIGHTYSQNLFSSPERSPQSTSGESRSSTDLQSSPEEQFRSVSLASQRRTGSKKKKNGGRGSSVGQGSDDAAPSRKSSRQKGKASGFRQHHQWK